MPHPADQCAPISAPKTLLTKADCRALGMARCDVDRMFDRVPLFTPPDSRKTYVRRDVLDAFIERHTRIAPRHQRTAA